MDWSQIRDYLESDKIRGRPPCDHLGLKEEGGLPEASDGCYCHYG